MSLPTNSLVRNSPEPAGNDSLSGRLAANMLADPDMVDRLRMCILTDAFRQAIDTEWESRAQAIEHRAGERFDDPIDTDDSAWPLDDPYWRARQRALNCRRHKWLLQSIATAAGNEAA